MRCVIQRVAQASVSVDGEQIGAIQQGFMVLIGVSTDDTDHDVHYMAEKCRISAFSRMKRVK